MSTEELKKILFFQNPWWLEKEVPPVVLPDFVRPVLHTIKNYAELVNRIIVIKGPRRTGKTTLLYQFIDSVIKEGIRPLDIIFISFDDPELQQCNLDQVFSSYEEIRQEPIGQKKIYCFLDEVHFSDRWQLYVKKYFDRKYPITFIVSSSSASLFKKGLESLAGRTIEEIILPFSFKEFVFFHLRKKKNFPDFLDRNRLAPYERAIKILFSKYLQKGGFPYIAGIEEPILWTKILKEDIVEKVIYRDLTTLYGIREPQKMEKMFTYLADISAQILNINKVAHSLSLSRLFAENYLTYLEQAYLIFRIKNFSFSAGKRMRSAAKVYLTDTGLINVFSAGNEDFIFESSVARELFFENTLGNEIYYYRDGYEIDLVIKKSKEIIPVEMKNKREIHEDDMRNIIKFMEENKSKRGFILSSGEEKVKRISRGKISIIPAWKFLLFKEEYLKQGLQKPLHKDKIA